MAPNAFHKLLGDRERYKQYNHTNINNKKLDNFSLLLIAILIARIRLVYSEIINITSIILKIDIIVTRGLILYSRQLKKKRSGSLRQRRLLSFDTYAPGRNAPAS